VPQLLNLLNREETVARVVPAISKSRPETHAAYPAADEAEQLDFGGAKNSSPQRCLIAAASSVSST